jgi:3-oxoacyl-[acyl-carrier-protein] synthase-3
MAAEGEVTSDMAARAAERALAHAGASPGEVDMIIVGTVTGDMPFPACAAFVQKKLGIKDVPAFDVSAACAGFLFGLSVADQFVKTGAKKRVLVIGVELLSRIVDWTDRTTCVLFGDGAGAVLLGPSDGTRGVHATRLHTDSTFAESLCIRAGGSARPLDERLLAEKQNKVYMNGQDIFKVAVRNLTSASKEALDDAGLTPEDIDWVVPHQANTRIISQVAQRVGIPLERFVLNIERYGNTSSASIPLALQEGIADGRIKPGQKVLMCALGGGVSWASAVVTV